jgi:hypothetical protein
MSSLLVLLVILLSTLDIIVQSRLTSNPKHSYPDLSPEVQSCLQSVRNRSAYPGETFLTYAPPSAGLGIYHYSDRTSFIMVSHHLHR